MENTGPSKPRALRTVAARLVMAVIIAIPLAFFFEILEYRSYAKLPVKLYQGNALLSFIGLIALCYIGVVVFLWAKSSAKDGGSTLA